MLPLTVNDGGYLTVDTDAWLDDISEVSQTWTDVFNAYCDMRKAGDYSFYVSDSVVRDWADSLGTATGIYGEDSPFTMSTINYDTFLENEISYTFLHLERNVLGEWREATEDEVSDYLSGHRTFFDAAREAEHGLEVAEYETHHDALVIVHGWGYSYASAGDCEVRVFNGDDDADIVSHSRGYAAHSTREDCGKEWIIDDVSTLWNNGGSDSVRIDDCVMPDDEGMPQLVCPACGDILNPFTN